MIRSTHKEVKEAIKNYIMEHFADYHAEQLEFINKNGLNDDYDNLIANTDPTNYNDVCTAILGIFKAEYLHRRNRNYNTQELFYNWCSGLCSAVDTSYFYNVSAVELLASWLQETDEEKNRYTEDEAEKTITNLLYREISSHS